MGEYEVLKRWLFLSNNNLCTDRESLAYAGMHDLLTPA